MGYGKKIKDWFTDDEWNQLNKSIETQVRYKKLNTFILYAKLYE